MLQPLLLAGHLCDFSTVCLRLGCADLTSPANSASSFQRLMICQATDGPSADGGSSERRWIHHTLHHQLLGNSHRPAQASLDPASVVSTSAVAPPALRLAMHAAPLFVPWGGFASDQGTDMNGASNPSITHTAPHAMSGCGKSKSCYAMQERPASNSAPRDQHNSSPAASLVKTAALW